MTKPNLPIDEILFGAATRSGVERGRYLDDACGGDAELRKEVESLLKAYDSSQDFLSTPPVFAGLADDDEPNARPGQSEDPLLNKVFGAFRLDSFLGSGGMGSVYLASRQSGEFDQRVAVKVMPSALVRRDGLRRFQNECRALARLEHPNVARMIDGGQSTDGIPFIAMEYVDGLPITRFVENQNLSVRDRVELFLDVCDAVGHVHNRALLHRDIKPANVLVTADGNAKVVDFGIARLLDGGEDATLTQMATPYTPRYASPEQLTGDDLTTATDIYSLGLLLYELLTGTLPFDWDGPSQPDVSTATPPAPSKSARRREGQAMRIDGDLDNIVLKAIRREPDRRYASVDRLADDLRRYLSGYPVTARPDTLIYRTRMFLGRNRAGVAVTGLLLATIVTAALVSFRQAQVARREARSLQATNAFIYRLFTSAASQRQSRDRTLSDMLDDASARMETEFPDVSATAGRLHNMIGRGYFVVELPDRALPHAVRAADMLRSELGPRHPETRSVELNLAEMYYELGRFEEALPYVESVVRFCRQELGEKDPETMQAIHDLGWLYAEMQRVDEGEPLLREAYDLRNRHLTMETRDLRESCNDFGLILSKAGKLKEAEQLLRRKLDHEVALHNNAYSNQISSTEFNMMAAIYRQGRVSDALEVLQGNLDRVNRQYDPHEGRYLRAHGWWLRLNLLANPAAVTPEQIDLFLELTQDPESASQQPFFFYNYRPVDAEVLLLAGRVEEARAAIELQLPEVRAHLGPERDERIYAELIRLQIQNAAGDPGVGDAGQHWQRARDHYYGLVAIQSLVAYGDALVLANRYDDALALFSAEFPRLATEHSEYELELAHAQALYAKLLQAANRPEANQVAADALAALRRLAPATHVYRVEAEAALNPH